MTISLSADMPPPPQSVLIRRHSFVVRLTHWINVLCLSFLLLSGLQIFNAHPQLYIGQYGADADKPFIEIGATSGDDLRGFLRIGPVTLPTTGVLGVSSDNGEATVRAFPSWATIPSYQDLSTGRRWHFFAAWLFVLNGLAYLVYGIVAGHFHRDLVPDRDQLRPAHLRQEIADHAHLRFARGQEARRYNALQKLAYLAVIALLLPAMIGSGLTMSPGMDAAFPWLLDLFGGRQTARTVHFIVAWLLVGFVVVHVAMVVLSGPWNNLRSMITGRYSIKPDDVGRTEAVSGTIGARP